MNQPDSYADIAFLAGSPNRVAILSALVTAPSDRPGLAERTGIPRVTINRILRDIVARGWITPSGERYRATPIGEVVAAAFGEVAETIRTMTDLAALVEWLPEDLDVDYRRLVDARITLPSLSDSVAPVRRAGDLVREATSLSVAATGVAPGVIRAIRDAAVAGGTVVYVATDEAVAVLTANPTMRTWMAQAIAAGAELVRHPGFPYLLAQCDDTAIIGVNDDAGAPRGLIEATDPAVIDWVRSRIDHCRADGTRIALETFAG